jgi:hypothetical protein
MKVQVVKMFVNGVEVERRMLSDRYTPRHRGMLTISDETNQGRHRPTKIARLTSQHGTFCELFDVQLLWLNEERMTLTGDERIKNAEGQTVCYRQSWLVMLDTEPARN